MLKTKVKFLIIALGLLVTLCLFNTNTVNATTQEEIQRILDLIPNEMYLDIPEAEYEKVPELMKSQIEGIWINNGIDIEKYKYECYQKMYSKEWFYVGRIIVNGKEKEIKLVFNNTDKFNSNDEQYVKKLKLENPKYLEMNLDYLTKYNNSDELWNWFQNYMKDYYTKKINDNSVKVTINLAAGTVEGLNLGTTEGGIYLNIFKNNKFYDVVHIGNLTLIPVINVTQIENNSILKEEVVNEVKKYYPEYASYITDVRKGVPEWVDESIYEDNKYVYTIEIPNDKEISSTVILKETNNMLQLKDKTTNIKIDTTTAVLPTNTQLVANEIKEGETYNLATTVLKDFVDKMYVYDITLQSNGVKVQPNGKVKVSIPVPEGLDTNKLVVYRIDKEGNKTEYKVKVETIDNIKHATFETNHFSTYVLGEKVEETTTNTETTTKGEKDETPKTGSKNTVINVLGTIAIITIVTVVTKKLIK